MELRRVEHANWIRNHLPAALAAVLCAFQAASAAGTNASTAATADNAVVARGTGLQITRGDLDEAMTGIKYAYQKQGQTMFRPRPSTSGDRFCTISLTPNLDPNLKPTAATSNDAPAPVPVLTPKP